MQEYEFKQLIERLTPSIDGGRSWGAQWFPERRDAYGYAETLIAAIEDGFLGYASVTLTEDSTASQGSVHRHNDEPKES